LASLANVDQMFMLDSCRFVTFEGLTFDNNEANQTGGEIRCIQTQDSVYNLKIKDCIFDGNGRIAASGSNGIYLYNCYDSIINNIYVDGWTRHDFMVLGYCDNIIVRNSTFKNLSTAGIILISEVENTIITNNFFDSIGDSSLGRGHAVTSNTFQTANEDLWPDKIIISNNICDGCFGDVIHVEHGFRFVICGNIIRSFFVTAADSTGDTGISCSAEQSVIFGNHVSGNAAPGITLFNNPKYATGYNMIAIGNSIFNNGIHTVSSPQRNGIWLDDVQRCIVACNNSSDNIDTQTYGVYSSGTSKYNIIANNMLSFNQTRPLHFTSDSLDNIIFGNMEWQDGAATPDSTRGSSFWQHGDIDAGDFGGHKTAYTFYVDNIQDSVTTATQMESDGSEAKGYRMVYAGSVVGIVVAISGTQSAGTLTAEAYVNNAQTGLVATISTAVDAASSTQRMDIDTIAAEAALSVKYTTSNDWAPEDVDLYVTVIVEQ
ncbi:right-handed parallel beta-helix repeat-containing protein, partial [candidate division KSB1 bacterium]|nr:right-handed parallel beta-helix repeat-containing protein [candidate division KSB1 bacterium]